MSLWRLALAVLVLAVAGFAAYVRLAPSDPARWHQRPPDAPGAPGEVEGPGSFLAVRQVADPAAALAAADAAIRATPRTRVIAGSPAEGMVTYRTRSRLWGFPDYTTVWTEGDRIGFWGRLRFGGGDMGVNAARVRGWLATLGLS